MTNAPISITVPGTQFSPENMNKIEKGIYDAHEGIAEEAQARTNGDLNTLNGAKEYTDEKIADTVAATQKWLPAVDTLGALLSLVIADTSRNYLCRVREQQAVYQRVAGQTAWLLYSDKTDLVNELELADAVEAHNESEDAHADIRNVLHNEIQARQDADEALREQIEMLAPEGLENIPELLAQKAPINSPIFTGTPKVPTKSSAASSDGTLIATEAQVALKANLASPVFTGTPKVPSKTSAASSDGTLIATEAQVALKANLASPVFTGSPKIGSDRIAVVPNTSTQDETNLPIGSYIGIYTNSGQPPNRNAAASPRFSTWTHEYDTTGNGSLLSGTWRNSGSTGFEGGKYWLLLRRVA